MPDRDKLTDAAWLRDLAEPYDDALPSYKPTADRLRAIADRLDTALADGDRENAEIALAIACDWVGKCDPGLADRFVHHDHCLDLTKQIATALDAARPPTEPLTAHNDTDDCPPLVKRAAALIDRLTESRGQGVYASRETHNTAKAILALATALCAKGT